VRRRAHSRTQVRTDRGAGRRADRVRRTWRGLSGLRSGSRRAGRSDLLPLQCDGESGVHSPFPLGELCYIASRHTPLTEPRLGSPTTEKAPV
jgi:hypothetical protein